MGADVTLDPPIDGVTTLTDDWLNANVRDPLRQILQPPTCILLKTDTQTIFATPTWTIVTWNTLIADTEDPATPMYNTANKGRVTIHTPGLYECSFDFSMLMDNGGNSLTAAFRVDGVTYYAGDTVEWPASTTHVTNVATILQLQAADYVQVAIRMSRVSNLTSTNFWNTPRFSVRRVRGL